MFFAGVIESCLFYLTAFIFSPMVPGWEGNMKKIAQAVFQKL